MVKVTHLMHRTLFQPQTMKLESAKISRTWSIIYWEASWTCSISENSSACRCSIASLTPTISWIIITRVSQVTTYSNRYADWAKRKLSGAKEPRRRRKRQSIVFPSSKSRKSIARRKKTSLRRLHALCAAMASNYLPKVCSCHVATSITLIASNHGLNKTTHARYVDFHYLWRTRSDYHPPILRSIPFTQ